MNVRWRTIHIFIWLFIIFESLRYLWCGSPYHGQVRKALFKFSYKKDYYYNAVFSISAGLILQYTSKHLYLNLSIKMVCWVLLFPGEQIIRLLEYQSLPHLWYSPLPDPGWHIELRYSYGTRCMPFPHLGFSEDFFHFPLQQCTSRLYDF